MAAQGVDYRRFIRNNIINSFCQQFFYLKLTGGIRIPAVIAIGDKIIGRNVPVFISADYDYAVVADFLGIFHIILSEIRIKFRISVLNLYIRR